MEKNIDLKEIFKVIIAESDIFVKDVNITKDEILALAIKVFYEIIEEVNIFLDRVSIDLLEGKKNLTEYVKIKYITNFGCDCEESIYNCVVNDEMEDVLKNTINAYCNNFKIEILDIIDFNKNSLLEYTSFFGRDLIFDFDKYKLDNFNYNNNNKKFNVIFKIIPFLWQIEEKDVMDIRNAILFGIRYYSYLRLSDVNNENFNLLNKKIYENIINDLKDKYSQGLFYGIQNRNINNFV